MARKVLHLDLDVLYTEGYYCTEYDLGGEGHGITVEVKDKDSFLDAFAAIWRKNTEALLEERDDWEDRGW